MSFERVETLVSHKGCVNTMKWSKDGTKLITGSDDKCVKIWNHQNSSEGTTLRHTIHTGHRSNIFCADFSPSCESVIVSCAADGTLYKNDINSTSAEVKLMKSDGLMHMFIFDVDQPQVIYTAEDIGRGYTPDEMCKGVISRIDLRTNIVETIFSTDILNFNMMNPLSETMTSVKALSQSDVLGGSQLLIGGSRSFSLGLLDIRCLSPTPAGASTVNEMAGSQFVKTWEPLRHRHLQKRKSLHEACEVSVSGLCFSANGASILASYQSDQIYIFDTYGEGTSETLETSYTSTSTSTTTTFTTATATTGCPRIGPKSLLGGHVNHATFLKSVAFFGPKDEFVVSGSDSGHLWIWDAKSGNLDIDEPHDRTCRVVNFLKADDSTCNGAVPHPYAPILGSYGIASDVKLWACDSPIKNKGIRSEPSYSSHAYIPRSCRVNKLIEEETRYQGRGIDGEYKRVRSEHCDMDRLPAYLKIQRANISNDGNDPPLVSDIKQYKITVNAIRTDPVTMQSIGDSAHLPPCYQKQSVAIGPDYMTDFLTFSQRKGWKTLFTHDQRRDIEDRIQEMYFDVATKKINEENEKLNLKNSKIVKIVTPDTNKSKSITDEIRSSKIVDLQLLVLTELVKMTPVETWDRLKKQDAFGNTKTPFDFFPNTCVALCEINRIGNEIKMLGNDAFRNKKFGCARILYEKALRYSDQSITLTSNSDWTGSCIVQVPSAPHVTHKNVRLRSTYGDDDYYEPNGDIYGEDEDDDEEDEDDEDDEDGDEEEDDVEEEEEEEEEEEDEDAILQDRISQINAVGDGEGNGRNEDEDEDWGDGFDGRQIQYFEPPYTGPNCLRPLFPPGFPGSKIVLGDGYDDNSDNKEDNMEEKQDDDVIMGENEVEMKDSRRGNEVEVETTLKSNGDDRSEDDNLNEIKTEGYTKEDVRMSCDEYENGQTEEITTNHTIKCTPQSALSTPIASSSSSNQHIAQPLLFNIMSKDVHKKEKKFCTENFQKSVSRTLSPYFTECNVDHNYTNMSQGEETTLETANDKFFKNTNTGIKNGKNGVNEIEEDERGREEGADVGRAKGTDDKMEDCLEWLQKREEVMEREIAISIISAVQQHVVEDSMTELSLACLSNLIATELQSEDFVRAKKTFERSLVCIAKVHAKLLFRGACALFHLGERARAMTTIQDAHKLSPTDKLILKKMKEFKNALEAVNTAEKRKYSKMFSK